jgi:hypothetical protein
VEGNRAAAELMARHGIRTNGLFAALTPQLSALQNPTDVQFNAAGSELLGRHVADAIAARPK